jgi:hypothetical protein
MNECIFEAIVTLNSADEVASVENSVSSVFESFYERERTLEDKIILTIKLKHNSIDDPSHYYLNLLAKAILEPFRDKEKPKVTIHVKPLVQEAWYTF